MALRFISTGATWNGEPINDVRYPRSIASRWSLAELTAIGLEPIPAPEPTAQPPAPRRILGDFREFMDLFTQGEQLAILAAAKVDPALELWLFRAQGGAVPLDHPDTAAGLDALVAGGLITTAARDAVLAADYNDGKTTRVDV